MNSDFKQLSSLQYITHVCAAAVVLESVNRYESFSTTLIVFNLVVKPR